MTGLWLGRSRSDGGARAAQDGEREQGGRQNRATERRREAQVAGVARVCHSATHIPIARTPVSLARTELIVSSRSQTRCAACGKLLNLIIAVTITSVRTSEDQFRHNSLPMAASIMLG